MVRCSVRRFAVQAVGDDAMRLVGACVAMVLVVGSTVGAEAQARRWTSGFGQGIIEYTTRNGPGNTFRIACDAGYSDNGELTNLTIEIGGKPPKGGSTVRIFIDDEDIQIGTERSGEMKFNSRVGVSNFHALWEALKTGKQLRVLFADGQSTTFPMAGAAKEITGEPCKTGL